MSPSDANEVSRVGVDQGTQMKTDSSGTMAAARLETIFQVCRLVATSMESTTLVLRRKLVEKMEFCARWLNAWFRAPSYYNEHVRSVISKTNGFSVRCVRDAE